MSVIIRITQVLFVSKPTPFMRHDEECSPRLGTPLLKRTTASSFTLGLYILNLLYVYLFFSLFHMYKIQAMRAADAI